MNGLSRHDNWTTNALSILVLVTCGLVVATDSRAKNGQTQTIAQSGQAAPDGNGSLSNLFSPVLNDSGLVAFSALLTGTSGRSGRSKRA